MVKGFIKKNRKTRISKLVKLYYNRNNIGHILQLIIQFIVSAESKDTIIIRTVHGKM